MTNHDVAVATPSNETKEQRPDDDETAAGR
jgi:hypothetical protein